MRAIFTIDTQSTPTASQTIDWGADGITVINPTLSSIIIGQGPTVPASVAIPNSIFVPPLSVMSRPVSGSVFAAGFTQPALTSSQDWPTTAQIALTQGEPLPSYGSFPITDIQIGSGSSVDVNVVNASIPITTAATLDVSVQNPSIPITSSGTLDVNVQNASIPITTSGNIDVNVQNASIETNAGILSGGDTITGSPFAVASGATGGTGSLTMSTWGGLALQIVGTDTLASRVYTAVNIDVSQNGSTWYTIHSYGIGGQGAITAVIPRLAPYMRVNIPTAGTADVTIFARYVRTEIVAFEESVNGDILTAFDEGSALSAGSWSIQSMSFPPSVELLSVSVAGSLSSGQSIIGVAMGSGGTGYPILPICFQTFSATSQSILLGPFEPGHGIPINGNTDFLLYCSSAISVDWTLAYR